MRISAQILFAAVFCLLAFLFFNTSVYAQTTISPTPFVAQTSAQSSSTINNFLTPNVDANVPQNQHEYTQIVLINVMSAIMCQLTGVDPTNPQQSCLGVDPTTGKIGMAPTNAQTFGQTQNQPQIGGAVGAMNQYISSLYIPAVSSTQYVDYLSSNFGLVKKTYAALKPGGAAGGAPFGTGGSQFNSGPACINSFGFGFCGLSPIFNLWAGVRDIAYTMLTILFIAIGIGIMLRFRVDPRTVMTLQNQIPRVIIAILLITFSYAIAGFMVDLMWTATFAGINFISSETNTQVGLCPNATPLSNVADQRLNDEPVSFVNTIFRTKCEPAPSINSGLLGVADGVSNAFGGLVTQLVSNVLGLNAGGCNLGSIVNPVPCFESFFLWLTEQIVKLIIIIALLIALFRLWFQLITCYVTFLIFVIMGPIWIVMGLIPGRPLGFEKWLRIVFANLAVFPLVAFILVFARVIIDAGAHGAVLGAATSASAGTAGSGHVLAAATSNAGSASNPQSVFIPPLVGNPNISTFTTFIGFGAIMIAPTIPNLIKERMKATGQGKYGATIAAGIGAAAGAATSPARKTWEGLNRRNPTTGAPEGALAIMKQRGLMKTPLGRRAIARRQASHAMYTGQNDGRSYGEMFRENKVAQKVGREQTKEQKQDQKQQLRNANASGVRRFTPSGRATRKRMQEAPIRENIDRQRRLNEVRRRKEDEEIKNG